MSPKIKLVFCGDFVAKSPEQIVFSEELVSLIADCNLKCINFEAPVINKGNPINKGGSGCLSQSADSPEFLESMGFNVIAMSNNHMYDFGETGITETQNKFRSSLTVGVGTWETAYNVKTVNINNKTIGFLSLTHTEFGVLNDVWDNSIQIGCAGISYSPINKIIANAKQTVDYLFIMAHAGIEYLNHPLPEWRDKYRQFIDCGADAVIASHPHVPQGWEDYNGRPIFYSLGNFFFDMNATKPYWNDGLIALLEIDSNKNSLSYKAEYIHRNNNKIALTDSDEIKKHVQKLCDDLKDDHLYRLAFEKSLLAFWPLYQNMILAGLNLERSSIAPKNFLRFISHSFHRKANLPIFLNLLRCESHLWALRRIIAIQQQNNV